MNSHRIPLAGKVPGTAAIGKAMALHGSATISDRQVRAGQYWNHFSGVWVLSTRRLDRTVSSECQPVIRLNSRGLASTATSASAEFRASEQDAGRQMAGAGRSGHLPALSCRAGSRTRIPCQWCRRSGRRPLGNPQGGYHCPGASRRGRCCPWGQRCTTWRDREPRSPSAGWIHEISSSARTTATPAITFGIGTWIEWSSMRWICSRSPLVALRMATLNTAQHIDLERERGSIEPGQRADFTLTNYLKSLPIVSGHSRGIVLAEKGEIRVRTSELEINEKHHSCVLEYEHQ